MEAIDKAANLKQRLDAFTRDRFVKVVTFFSPTFIVPALLPNESEPWWAKYIMAALFVPLLLGLVRHRFYISALGIVICIGGAALSVWYHISETKRPSWDHYTGLTLLVGLTIVGLDILVSWIRVKALEKAEEQTVLIEQ